MKLRCSGVPLYVTVGCHRFLPRGWTGKGVNFWRGFNLLSTLTVRYSSSKYTTVTAILFVFALVSSSFRSLIDSLCNMFYLQTCFALAAIPFWNISLKCRNCTGLIGRLPAIKKEKGERDNLSSSSPKPLIFTEQSYFAHSFLSERAFKPMLFLPLTLPTIECVHMTSRGPCWGSKQRNGGHVGGVKYSIGNWTLFLCKFLLLFHYANMASGHMSEHTLLRTFAPIATAHL